ncbi:unnamed protein product [Vitrella brassicaformis CCMP3155]|uniref:Uncharacterized protein n=1 Tax=Vitrella brassicaformis (strain CCMP3155) TaxID=1169540 RepID=A0A0G4FD23_VITBC|nr:unnamed protein product [Vitrella brassicaformis CCMP3155]|eukprot:CEM11121.1 unnamed protein product [Vitrella brassicaformis CCMP3155]
MQQPEQQQQQQHPFSYIFVGRRTFYLFSSIKDILRLRATCTWLRDLFGAAQLRDRLRHSLGSQAGLRRAVNGQQVQLLRFDDDQFGTHDLLAAVCVVEEGPWGEMAEAYVSAPRMLAQLKMVGRHVLFDNDTCLHLVQHNGGEWRAIIDQPGFELEVDPPLPAGHLYQQHRQPHDPPVNSSSIYYWGEDGWSSAFNERTHASVSSFAKFMILYHFYLSYQFNDISMTLNRVVGGGRLDGLLTESPHTSVTDCTATMGRDDNERLLVLTNGSHPFVAWINIRGLGNNDVAVRVFTTEAAACESSPFKQRFPVITQLARVALGAVAPYVFDGQVQQQQQQQQDDDDDDSDDDSDDENDDEGNNMDDGSGEGDGGEDGAAEADSGG